MHRDLRFYLTFSSFNILIFLIASLFLIFPLSGCDVGGGNGGSDNDTSSDENIKPLIGILKIGVPIGGVVYSGEYSNGITDSVGRFEYAISEEYIPDRTISDSNSLHRDVIRTIETIRFSIGSVVLGVVEGNTTVTPVDLVKNTENKYHPTVINIGKFLLTLDDDGIVDNGILITEPVREAATDKIIDFQMSVSDFENNDDIRQIVDELTDLTTEGQRDLISTNDTQDQLDHEEPDISEYRCGDITACLSGYVVDKSKNIPVYDFGVGACEVTNGSYGWCSPGIMTDENGFFLITLDIPGANSFTLGANGGSHLNYPPTAYDQAIYPADAKIIQVGENEHIENIIVFVEEGVHFHVVVLDEDENLIKLPPGNSPPFFTKFSMIGIQIWDENKIYMDALNLGHNTPDDEPQGVLKDGIFPCNLYPGKYYFRIIALGGDPEGLYSYGYVPEWYHSDPKASVTVIDDAELFEILEPPPVVSFYLKKYDPLK